MNNIITKDWKCFAVYDVAVEDTSTVQRLTPSYLGMQSGDIFNYQLSIGGIGIADSISNARLYGESCQSANSTATVMMCVKPQTHGEREARKISVHKKVTSQLVWLYELLINVASHQNWGKSLHLASSRARPRARHVYSYVMENCFTLLACRVFAA